MEDRVEIINDNLNNNNHEVNIHELRILINEQFYNQNSPIEELGAYSDELGFSLNRSNLPTEDEPSLLDKLGIYTKKILKKCIGMLNPMSVVPMDINVIGPLLLFLMLSLVSLLKGRSEFHYVYSSCAWFVLGSAGFYVLLWVMVDGEINNANMANFSGVFSILGYCLQPMILSAMIDLIMQWCGFDIQLQVTLMAFAWSVLSAARQFLLVYELQHDQILIALHCIVFYAYFVLILL